MIYNDKGSALVLVLLMIVVLSALGLAVLGSTLNDAKQTSFREQDIITIHEAQTAVEEAIALIRATFNYQGSDVTLDEHNTKIQQLLGQFDFDDFTFNNVPSNFVIMAGNGNFNSDTDFSRDFIIYTRANDSNGRIVEFNQNVYLSAIPSFLYYAVGSGSSLNLQGASSIFGNVYTGGSLTFKSEAEYIFNDPTPKSINSSYPYLIGEIVIDTNPIKQFHLESTPYMLNNQNISLFNDTSGSVTTIGDVDFFNDVDINNTFVDKFNEIASTNISNPDLIKYDHPNRIIPGGKFYHVETNPIGELVDPESLVVNPLNCPSPDRCSPYIEGSLILKSSIDIPHNHWLLVTGDLWIYPEANSGGIEIDGNILVAGNIFIIGHVKFDSSIFSLEKTYINSAKIDKLHDDAALILFSRNELDVARVSEFVELVEENTINAFLYTASDAVLYGVGSKVHINGGIFAEGELTINAVRGEIEKFEELLIYASQPEWDLLDKDKSRFQVHHAPHILSPAYSEKSKSYSGLPRTSNFNIVLDRREFNRR